MAPVPDLKERSIIEIEIDYRPKNVSTAVE